jgi:hypothetical protein
MNEQSCISTIETELASKGFNLGNTEKTKEFISIIVKNVLLEVKKGTVSTAVTGTSATGGPVTGTGTGSIS